MFRALFCQLLPAGIPMDAATIQAMIESGLSGCSAQVDGADGVHFEARVIAQQFSGLPTIKRHRLVYATLGSKMGNEIHALALKTLTPDEAK